MNGISQPATATYKPDSDPPMGFGHLEIFASEPARSRDFYERVLGFEPTVEQPGGFLWLRKGDLEILIRPGRPPASAPCYEGCGLGLVLYTDQLGATLEELRARGLEIRGTVDSERCYTFTDPDGNWFQLVDPAAP